MLVQYTVCVSVPNVNVLTFSGFCVHSMVFMMLAGCLQVSITLTVNFRKRSSVIDGSQLRDLSVGNVNLILSTPTKTFLRMLISYLEQYVHAKNGHLVLSLYNHVSNLLNHLFFPKQTHKLSFILSMLTSKPHEVFPRMHILTCTPRDACLTFRRPTCFYKPSNLE